MTTTFSKTPTSQLLNRHVVAAKTRTKSTPVHGQVEIPPRWPVGSSRFGPFPPAPPGGTAACDADGEGVPLTAKGGADGVGGEKDGTGAGGEGESDGCGVGFGPGGGLGGAVGAGGLIVYVVQAGLEVTDASLPHTMYAPGPSLLGGAVAGVELAQLVPLPVAAGLVAQSMVLPNDQDTWLWYPEHEPFGVNE